ncbi:MAG: hypothetical protein AAGF12_37860 [Myxococcota bacterium]
MALLPGSKTLLLALMALLLALMALLLALMALAIAPRGAAAQEPQAVHPDVRLGVEAYEGGDLRGAAEALARAEAQRSLTRDDVVVLLIHRALVQYAQRERESLDATLLRLATLAGEEALGRRAPPRLRRSYAAAVEAVVQPLAVEVRREESDGRVRVEGTVVGDQGGLVDRVRVSLRSGGDWESADGALEMAVVNHRVEYAVEAIGLGGAVLASEGTRAAPELIEVARPEVALEETLVAPRQTEPDEGGSGWWIGLGIGLGVLLVAGGVVLGWVLLSDDESENMVSAPMVSFE